MFASIVRTAAAAQRRVEKFLSREGVLTAANRELQLQPLLASVQLAPCWRSTVAQLQQPHACRGSMEPGERRARDSAAQTPCGSGSGEARATRGHVLPRILR